MRAMTLMTVNDKSAALGKLYDRITRVAEAWEAPRHIKCWR